MSKHLSRIQIELLLRGPTLQRISNEDVLISNNEGSTPLVERMRNRRTLLNTYDAFYKHPDEFKFKMFEPVQRLLDRVKDLPISCENTIGVHIRRTDHAHAIEANPIDAFEKSIEHEIQLNPGITFFLATDDVEVETRMKHRFGSRVFSCKKSSWKRTEAGGIDDAIVDLWALSRCRKVIGSKGSSFSFTGAAIGSRPLSYPA